MFKQEPLTFLPGLYANRSKRSSRQRWVDGNLVRFRDGVPEQIGGWRRLTPEGAAIEGVPRDFITYRPISQIGRYGGIGTHLGYFLYNGTSIADLTPDLMVSGRVDSELGAGYGSGSYGGGGYGTARDVATIQLDASVWTTDMFGEILIGCFNTDESVWSFDITTDSKLQPVEGVTARAICVSDERHLFAFGMNGNAALVGWSDREDFSNFTPTVENRAGSYEMQATSAFQCGKRVRGFILAWTATEVFGFFPLNNSLVYGRERLSTNAGAAGPKAVAVVTDNTGETAYWMGVDNFFTFDGIVSELDCELRDYVFKDINKSQRAKFYSCTNSQYSEVWFFYCSAGSSEIDRAVILDYSRKTWSKAEISRTAWLDRGTFTAPIGLTSTGIMYEHEVGETADGEAMPSYVTSHPIMVGMGQNFADIDQFWPDMQEGSAPCRVSFITRDYAGAPDVTYGPFDFAWTDEKIDLAISCRQFQVKVAGMAGYWELGLPMISIQGGGAR